MSVSLKAEIAMLKTLRNLSFVVLLVVAAFEPKPVQADSCEEGMCQYLGAWACALHTMPCPEEGQYCVLGSTSCFCNEDEVCECNYACEYL